MTLEEFTESLLNLDEGLWRDVAQGGAILLLDDERFESGPAGHPNALVAPADGIDQRDRYRNDPESLYREFYRTHPLSLAGFNRQVKALFEALGAESFTAQEGELARRTLFVEAGEVLAQAEDSPTFRYGTYLELTPGLLSRSPADKAWQWLNSGEAYETYLSMNVCRYNCGT